MKEMNVKAFIDGKEFSTKELELWNVKRLKKACRTLKIKTSNNQDVLDLYQEVMNKKEKLTHDEMLKLLHKKLYVSRLIMKFASVLSGRHRRTSQTTVFAEGITAEKFSQMLDDLMLKPSKENRSVNLSANLEHYILNPVDGVLEVVETTGNSPLPTQFFITFHDEQGIVEPANKLYTHQSVGVAKLNDGTIIGGVRHQFRDTSSGIECRLLVEFPALCPKFLIKAHQKHLAVEFTNWAKWIIANQDNH